jgi:hypothetical protein
MIKRLGKRKSFKHPLGDYIRRAWGTVIANSVCKDLNWCGRKDKRVNNGNGKRGLKDCLITKAIRRKYIDVISKGMQIILIYYLFTGGIERNKDVGPMDDAVFIKKTAEFLKNAKTSFTRKQAKLRERPVGDENESEPEA